MNMHLFYAMDKNKHNKYVYCWEEMLQYVLILAPTHTRGYKWFQYQVLQSLDPR